MTPAPLAWIEEAAPDEALARLRRTGSLARLLPEVDALYGVPQSEEHHPEVDTGIHTELCLAMAERIGASPRARFAVLLHDLGKALTPRDEWPKHIDHERRGLDAVAGVCSRFAVPSDWTRLALLVCGQHLNAHRALEMRPASIVRMLQAGGLDGEDDRFFEDFVAACEADKRGRAGRQDRPYPQGRFLREARREAALRPYPPGITMHSEPVGVRIHEARVGAVRSLQARSGAHS